MTDDTRSFVDRVGKKQPYFSLYLGNGTTLNAWTRESGTGKTSQIAEIVHEFKDKEGKPKKETITLPADAAAALSLGMNKLFEATIVERSQSRGR